MSAAFCQRFEAIFPILLGTTGACNNTGQGGKCTQTSTLVLLDPQTGALIKTIGPVGFTVNGLAWDPKSLKLYATTAAGDATFHGLITINPFTGKGTPVNKNVVNFGLGPGKSPIHSIAIDVFGHMVGWYDEFSSPGVPTGNDSYVRINQRTGVATEFSTGLDTSRNGLSFGEFNVLWNIDAPRFVDDALAQTQTAHMINPFDGKPLLSKLLCDPPTDTCQPTNAALGDFRPGTNLYYGLNFESGNPTTFIMVVDPIAGTVTELGQTVDDLHTITFIKGLW